MNEPVPETPNEVDEVLGSVGATRLASTVISEVFWPGQARPFLFRLPTFHKERLFGNKEWISTLVATFCGNIVTLIVGLSDTSQATDQQVQFRLCSGLSRNGIHSCISTATLASQSRLPLAVYPIFGQVYGVSRNAHRNSGIDS